MTFDASFDVVGDAGVERAVGAFQDVEVPWGRPARDIKAPVSRAHERIDLVASRQRLLHSMPQGQSPGECALGIVVLDRPDVWGDVQLICLLIEGNFAIVLRLAISASKQQRVVVYCVLRSDYFWSPLQAPFDFEAVGRQAAIDRIAHFAVIIDIVAMN